MGPVRTLRRAVEHPALVVHKLHRYLPERRTRDAIDVPNEDWDTLLILDACRYDVFEEENTLPGELSRRTSNASATPAWIRRNFSAARTGPLHDLVYVTASGWYDRLGDELAELHAASWLYTEEYRNEMGTVDPAEVTDAALEAAERYPSKRLLVHYVQPHKPYLGPTAERYFRDATNVTMTELLHRSDGSVADLRRAYRETLRRTLPEVARLIDALSGKTVVSADHGELLGERYATLPFRNFGHPIGVDVPELREVPWLECPFEERRDVVAEPPEARTDSRARDELEEHLAAMGYVDR